MSVPSVMLKQMYVEGSLRNTPHGFEFALKNRIAPATIIEIGEVHAAGRTYGPEAITIHLRSHTYPATQIDGRRSLTFGINEIARVEVNGQPLPLGEHILTWRVRTKEVGWLRIPVEDTLGVVTTRDEGKNLSSRPKLAW